MPAADPPTQPLLTVRAGVPADQTNGHPDPARDRVPAATPWTFVDVFAGLGVVLLMSMLIAAPIQFANVQGGSALLLVSALPVWIGLLGTTFWACRRHGTGNLVTDLALRFRPVDLAIGLGAGLGLRFVIGIWTIAYSAITGQQPTGNLNTVLGDGLGTGLWLVINMVVIAIIGPTIEEIFFRGLGLRSALASAWRRAGLPRFADPKRRVRYSIAATSLIFALLHVSEVNDLTSAVVLLPGLFLAGWVLGRLTVWSGRLGPAIVTHVVFNGVAVVALLALT
jgi:membrane protease YdiL (CAAX protease family)